MNSCTGLNDCIGNSDSITVLDDTLRHDGGNAAGLSGWGDINGFGNPVPFAVTFTEAVENTYARANYNANWYPDGTKKGWTLYPSERYTKNAVNVVLSIYTELAAGRKIATLTENVIRTEQSFIAIVAQILANIRSYTPETITTEHIRTILQEFHGAATYPPQTIDRVFINPKVADAPNAEDKAALERVKGQQEIQKSVEEAKQAEEQAKNDNSFFGGLKNKISSALGVPVTTAKVVLIGGSVVVVGGAGLLIWTIAKKANQTDTNKVISETHKTSRAVAGKIL